MQKFNAERERSYQKIEQLASRFEEQKISYLQSHYNETQTRRDFIDPFFKALGWDIDNENGYAESYREVIHEDRVKIGKTNKAPDYSFRLVGGKRLFFVEAKKPSVLIKTEEGPAFQVRRYGWSAKLPISIITDFQEFAVYDCTKKPLLTDKAATARIKYLTYTDYVNDFDFIWNTFSKQRVLEGSFDKFVQNDTYKKGTATVDHEFLQSLDNWRTQLAISISKSNKHLDEDEINFAVQHTIDRLIFLRIAEDRSIEPYGNLKDCIKDGNLYQNLHGLFLKADEKYNSGLFNFNKDKISHSLEIDNKVIRSIINDLYFPCPYEFSVLPVEILGTAYEQFLGKQIKIDKSHRVSIEEKPAVRKAGGVYYTPQYIVDYIVKNTVGKLIDGKTPKEVSSIKIVDPACGSGSFLLGAYEHLLNWHKDYYTKNGKISKGSKLDTLTPEGNLTTAEKKRILLNNIYGVDIDANAVEVTKLSLLIKCMDGETEASIATQMRLFHDRILPTLDNNIKSGNSLIDLDYYDAELDFGDEKKIKPFNWQKNFPEVFKQGGFDAVIGNPPYVQPGVLDKGSQAYLNKYYKVPVDLYALFIEKSLGLLKTSNSLGFIVPSLFIKGIRYEKLRDLINTTCSEAIINEYGDGIFKKVQMPTCVILLTKGRTKTAQNYFISKNADVFSKINTIPLGELSVTRRGLEIGKDKLIETGIKECVTGGDIECYVTKKGKSVSEETLKLFTKPDDIFSSPKLMVRETGNNFFSTIDYSGVLTTRSIYNTKIINEAYSYEYIAGIINSNLFRFYFNEFISPDTKVFPKIRIAQLNNLPIPKTFDQNMALAIESNVTQILNLKQALTDLSLQSKIDQLLAKINHIEGKINQLVYRLYNLTEEEIKTIEESFKD
jgi:type I restriction-modification system DNA methylase subunit